MNKIPADIWAEKWENKVQEHCRRRKNINQIDVISPRQAKVLAKRLKGLESEIGSVISFWRTIHFGNTGPTENNFNILAKEITAHIKSKLEVSDES